MFEPSSLFASASVHGAPLRQRAFSLLDRAFVPGASTLPAEEVRRRRLLALSAVLVVCCGLFIGFEALASNLWQPNLVVYVLWGASALTSVTLFFLRSAALAPWAAPLFCLELLGARLAIALNPKGTGFWDASVWWLGVVPVAAGLLVGPRFAVLCSAIIVVFLSVLYSLAPATPPPMGKDASWFRYLSGLTVVLTLTGLAWLYERSRREATVLVESALEEARAAADRLHELNETMAQSRDRSDAENQRKTRFLTRMRENAKAQRRALDETSAAMGEITTSLRVLSESVSTLTEAAEDCATAIRQMNVMNHTAGEQSQEMVTSAENTMYALQEMGASVREVAQHIRTLSLVAEKTAVSMGELEISFSDVQKHAHASERLAENVIQDAYRGSSAVKHTAEGIENIRASAKLAGDRMRGLGARIEDIDGILVVINDVAEQTQLLSLNAAIIASQAGEHGRSFGVVASEIKKLAERTSTSTREIAAVITSVQDESRAALEAIAAGERAVDEGLSRSQEAEHALLEIVRSTDETTRVIKAIVSTTKNQTRSVQDVADEMTRVASSVGQVASVTSAQAANAEELLEGTRRVQELALLVAEASQEQVAGGQRVETAVDRIQQMVEALDRAQRNQTRGSEQVLESLEAIGKSQGAQVTAIEHLDAEHLA